jgi:hypothetical protein
MKLVTSGPEVATSADCLIGIENIRLVPIAVVGFDVNNWFGLVGFWMVLQVVLAFE